MLGMLSTLECLLSLSFLVRRTDSLVNNSRLQCGGGGGGRICRSRLGNTNSGREGRLSFRKHVLM